MSLTGKRFFMNVLNPIKKASLSLICLCISRIQQTKLSFRGVYEFLSIQFQWIYWLFVMKLATFLALSMAASNSRSILCNCVILRLLKFYSIEKRTFNWTNLLFNTRMVKNCFMLMSWLEWRLASESFFKLTIIYLIASAGFNIFYSVYVP